MNRTPRAQIHHEHKFHAPKLILGEWHDVDGSVRATLERRRHSPAWFGIRVRPRQPTTTFTTSSTAWPAYITYTAWHCPLCASLWRADP